MNRKLVQRFSWINILLSELCTNILSHFYKVGKIMDSSIYKLISKMKMYSVQYCNWLTGTIQHNKVSSHQCDHVQWRPLRSSVVWSMSKYQTFLKKSLSPTSLYRLCLTIVYINTSTLMRERQSLKCWTPTTFSLSRFLMQAHCISKSPF